MKKIMKNIGWIVALISLDQIIKLVIYHHYFDMEVDIIKDLLIFSPIKNTKLSWGGNYISIFSNPIFLNIMNVLIILVFISSYYYYCSRQQPRLLGQVIFIVGMAGVICSFIDKICWGGSIDYIEIPSMFTFDLKDCYIDIWLVLFSYVMIRYNEKIHIREYIRFYIKKLRELIAV